MFHNNILTISHNILKEKRPLVRRHRETGQLHLLILLRNTLFYPYYTEQNRACQILGRIHKREKERRQGFVQRGKY